MTAVAAVPDASDLLALLLGDPGGDKVQSIFTDCAITTVTLGEVVGHFARIGSPKADILLISTRCRSFVSPWTRSSRSSPA